jgi:glycosidase
MGCHMEEPLRIEREIPYAPPPGSSQREDYQTRVFYELWVRAFQDSDGDGIGDLRGLKERIGELKELGIGGVWLMPIYPSPLKDSGYDISDYTGVHPQYGTLEDLKEVISTFHDAGILVYLDMVFNHTSTLHPWFQSLIQEKERSPYRDFYLLSPVPLTRCAESAIGPFGSERWSYLEELNLYYFHQFQPSQPDLNFWNPKVREELLKVLVFYQDLGVDGFRFDVPDRYYEKGSRCSMLPETLEFFSELRKAIRGGFVAEIWGVPSVIRLALTPDRFPMAFHFPLYFTILAVLLSEGSPASLDELLEISLDGLPPGVSWALISGNHDLFRLATFLGGDPQKLRLFFVLLLTLPGVPFIWMGDELGLPNGREIRVDPRDLSRTPYPWEPTPPGFGFTRAEIPFLRFVEDADRFAYSRELQDPQSFLRFVRRMIYLRNRLPSLHKGSFRTRELRDHLWVFERSYREERVFIFVNFSRTTLSGGKGVWGTDLLTGERVSGPIALSGLSFRLILERDED